MNENIERLYDLWAKSNPKFEKHYESDVIRKLSDYGIGASEATSAKGKILGGGYEPYIMAFFIGLYAGKKLPLNAEAKGLGQPVGFWGNLDSKKGRNAYPQLREYIFTALVAKTDIDFLALDKGEISAAQVVSQLKETMEEYANYGFSVMKDKMDQNENYFYNNTAFLNMFLSYSNPQDDSEEVESLD